jgi:hypothetical protein
MRVHIYIHQCAAPRASQHGHSQVHGTFQGHPHQRTILWPCILCMVGYHSKPETHKLLRGINSSNIVVDQAMLACVGGHMIHGLQIVARQHTCNTCSRLKPAPELASEAIFPSWGFVIVPSFSCVFWTIEITSASPSAPVTFAAQPRAVEQDLNLGLQTNNPGVKKPPNVAHAVIVLLLW